MGNFFGNNYKIIEKIGEGGFGEVYLIEKEGRTYALKKSKNKLNEDEMNQLQKIIDILSKIENDNIIEYYNSFRENDSFCILMEYAGKNNLKQFIESYKIKDELIEKKKLNQLYYKCVKV